LTFGRSGLDSGLDQYGAEPFRQQQFGTVGAEGITIHGRSTNLHTSKSIHYIYNWKWQL